MTALARVAPIDLRVAMVPRCTSSAWMVPRSIDTLTLSQDSTALRSAIFLSSSSTDSDGDAIDGRLMPGTLMLPHRFLTKSSVSDTAPTPGMLGICGLSMEVSVWVKPQRSRY
ncbi:hypothetical protein LP419_15265 [Massilia sp. H-1]|nr:hypothetical protein LP419_15265 [Massilia sp. H-1]